jgi:hypothetical protein
MLNCRPYGRQFLVASEVLILPVNPSSVVVSNRQNLARNFTENAVNVLCDAAFGAGAYAIGGSVLGVVSLTGPQVLVTTGALLAAMTLCPSRPDGAQIFGSPTDLVGGQCPYFYQVLTVGRVAGQPYRHQVGIQGPLRVARLPVSEDYVNYRVEDPSGNAPESVNLSIPGGDSVSSSIVSSSGGEDNCGNTGGSPGQVIKSTEGDTIDNSKTVNNQNYNTVIPVLVNLGGVKATVNMKFGDIKIKSLLPLEFNLKIGDVRFNFGEGDDGTIKMRPINPEEKTDADSPKEFNEKLIKLIEKIKECVCKPEVDLDMLFVPFATEETMCEVNNLTLLVPKGSIGPREELALDRSARLSSEMCKQNRIEQQEPKLITAATINREGAEFFSPEFSAKIISVRIKITRFNEELLPKISLYPASNQRKFGSVAYTLAGFEGGGDYIYVFDTDTYFPLPIRAKAGIIRVLFKPGTSFEIWDTGERTKTR